MRISSVTMSGFRCFGDPPVSVSLCDTTCFVGSNSTGKTAAIVALNKLFGIMPSDRQVEASDFHVPVGKSLRENPSPKLHIEVRIDFPEFEDKAQPDNAIAECFRQMVIHEEGATPHCKLRLAATLDWSTGLGEVDQQLSWVLKEGQPEGLRAVNAGERSRIQVIYVPAYRDPSRQLKHTSGTVMQRLVSAINWPEEMRIKVEGLSNEIRKGFKSVDALNEVSNALSKEWENLNADSFFKQVDLQPITSRFEDMIRTLDATFRPTTDGGEETIDRLSDGQKSLFYLGLIVSTIKAYQRVREKKSFLDTDRLQPPALCLLALEEPENHLAPHHLGRVAQLIGDLSSTPVGQVVISTHSPSLMRRMDPRTVRYFRSLGDGRCSVRRLTLPEEPEDEEKYVRLAIRAYPELYFSKVVLLVEGDSEEVVIPRLLGQEGIGLDSSFISIVPLAGRFVNHFWKLLNDLGIPHVTLLDLDRERVGGAWGRIKYAILQLKSVGRDCSDVLMKKDGTSLPDAILQELHKFPVQDTDTQNKLLLRLEKHGVFFSAPLDIDLLLLETLTEKYKLTVQSPARGPEIPDADAPDKKKKDAAVIAAVLKSEEATGETYTTAQKEMLFYWYRYLFVNGSKPTTHRLALSSATAAELEVINKTVLGRMVYFVKSMLPK